MVIAPVGTYLVAGRSESFLPFPQFDARTETAAAAATAEGTTGDDIYRQLNATFIIVAAAVCLLQY